MISRRELALGAVAFALLLTAACTVGDPLDTLTPATVETATFAPALGVDITKSTRTANGAYIRDMIVGTGAAIAGGDSIIVKYTGWLSDGTQFDASSSFATKIGVGHVIPGWDEGIPGMRIGGTRQILVPPSLAYGYYSYGPIPGNSVLVFSVQVLAKQ